VIEVNLLPGGKKGSGGGGNPFAGLVDGLKSLRSGGGGGGGGGSMDPYQLFFAGAASIALGYMVFQFLGLRSETEELQVQLDVAVQDSIQNASVISQINQLQAQGDSIEARVAVIQEIDRHRYVWPHILDEIAAAVPDYTWLREILYQADGPQVRIGGRAGSIFAITNFMNRLEASRFLRSVSPETIQEVASEGDPTDLVFLFELTLTYDQPPLEELETVPLFEEGTSQAQTAGPGN
jgi:Tfp pilus assembly protein PilN